MVAHPRTDSLSTIPDRIRIWKCWFLRRGENQSTRRKTSRSKGRTNNKLNPHVVPPLGFKACRSHWWEVSTLTTAPPLLPPNLSPVIWNHEPQEWNQHVFTDQGLGCVVFVGSGIKSSRPFTFDQKFWKFWNWSKWQGNFLGTSPENPKLLNI